MPSLSKLELRTLYRKKRLSLSPARQIVAAHRLSNKISPLIPTQSKVSVYAAVSGEINLRPLIKKLRAKRVNTYLPVVVAEAVPLIFRKSPVSLGKYLPKKHYNIPTPTGKNVRPKQLDYILLPLVAFDKQRNRLGMGGGFYDRTIAEIKRGVKCRVKCDRKRFNKQFWAVAHHCQYHHGKLPTEATDQKVHQVITSHRVYSEKNRRAWTPHP